MIAPVPASRLSTTTGEAEVMARDSGSAMFTIEVERINKLVLVQVVYALLVPWF